MTAPPLGRVRVDEALWAALISQRELGVAVCDASGLLVELNPALEAMLGEPYQRAKPEEWTGLYHLYDEHDQPLAHDDAPILQALRGEPVVDRVISTRPADGSIRHLRCNGARLHDRRGQSVGAVLFVADVTSAVRQRRQLEALRDQLVDIVNHEIRTPAAVIRGRLELLDDMRGELPDEAVAHLDPTLRAVGRLGDVLRTIRELTETTDASTSRN